jgi:hypothetical protein
LRARRIRRFPEQDFAKTALEQELLVHAQRFEKTLDVPVRDRPLLRPRSRVRPVLQAATVDDHMASVFAPSPWPRLRRREEGQKHTVRPKETDELLGERLRRCPIEVVEDIPAQDPVDAGRFLRKPFLQEGRKLFDEFVGLAIDVLVQILDDELAANLLAEKTEVGPDDRTEVENDGLRPAAQTGDETRERLGRLDRSLGGAGLRLSVFLSTTGEQIREPSTCEPGVYQGQTTCIATSRSLAGGAMLRSNANRF